MLTKLYVCKEHIIGVPEYLWCPMNYYKDDELNNGYVMNFIPLGKTSDFQFILN
jgi:hypothetical protein